MEACPTFAELSDREFLEAFARKAEAQGVPLGASIELTERCNLNCAHCYLGDQVGVRRRGEPELSGDRWVGILDQIAANGTLRLLITGGEPLLHPDFAQVYGHARRLGLLVTVFTNGTAVTPEITELFRALPPYAVEVSLYGATTETYERITGVPGSFGRCLDGIERLRSLGVALALKTILMKGNRHEIDRIAEMARSLGTQTFRFDTEIQAAFGGDRRPLRHRLDPEEAVRFELSCPETAATWREYFRRRGALVVGPSDRLYVCGAGKATFHVSAQGKLQPCLSVRHVRFDLLTGALADGLVALREELAARRSPLAVACNSCQDRGVCNSCPAIALQENGVEDRPAGFQCEVTRVRRRLIERLDAAGGN